MNDRAEEQRKERAKQLRAQIDQLVKDKADKTTDSSGDRQETPTEFISRRMRELKTRPD